MLIYSLCHYYKLRLMAPSLVFFPASGHVFIAPIPLLTTCRACPPAYDRRAGSAKAGGQALGATLRAAIAVQIVCPDNLSLNQTNLPGADLDIRRMPAGCAPWRAHMQLRLCFRSPYQVRGRLRHPLAGKIRRDHRIT